MKTPLEQNNYLFVNNFLEPERAKELYDMFKESTIKSPEMFTKDPQCPKSPAIYDYHPFVELLVGATPFIQNLVGEIMLPTYSYARMYRNGDVLAPHIDRGACEVSITLHLGSDGVEWPIYFRKPNGDVVGANLHPGQAIIYLGCVSEHWRNVYEGDDYAQVFLHYVKSRGPNGKYYFDKVKK
jgi:hypothetical protein